MTDLLGVIVGSTGIYIKGVDNRLIMGKSESVQWRGVSDCRCSGGVFVG